MQQLADLGIKIPVDKSPVQRARMKAYRHLAYIALFHAIMAVIVLVNQNAVVTWKDMLYTFAGSGTLALMDAATKYVTAQGDTSLSTLLKLARPEVAQYVPATSNPTTNQQALLQQFDNLVQPTPEMTATQSFNTSPPMQTSTIRYTAPAQPSQPAPVDANYHPAIQPGDMVNTFPGIPVVKPQ